MVRTLRLAAFGVTALACHAAAEPVTVGTGRVALTAAQLAGIVDGCCPKLPPDGGRLLAAQEQKRWERAGTSVIEALAAAGRLPAVTATAAPTGNRGASAPP